MTENVSFDDGDMGMSALMGADAQDTLAKAFQRALVQMNSQALKELAFIRLYVPEMEEDIRYIVNYRFHTNPGALRKIVDAIKAIALSDYHKEQNAKTNITSK